MATKVLLFAALAALLGVISAQGLSRVSGTYNGRYYDYRRYPTTGLPRGYDDDESGLSRVSGYYNGKYYDYKRYPTTGRSDRYYDDDMDEFKLKKLGKIAKKGFNLYKKYKQYTGGLGDDDEFAGRFGGRMGGYTGGFGGNMGGFYDDDEYIRHGRPCICVRAPCPCDNWDDDMDAFKLKKLGKLAKKGFSLYKKYKQVTGGLAGDDDEFAGRMGGLYDDDEQYDPELSASVSYNNGPWSATVNHDFGTRHGSAQGGYKRGPWDVQMGHQWDDDMDEFKLKKLGKLAKKGFSLYKKYKQYTGGLGDDDERYGGRMGGFY